MVAVAATLAVLTSPDMTKPVEPKHDIKEALRRQTLHHHSQLHLPRRSYWGIALVLILIALLAIQLSVSFQQQLRAYPATQAWLSLLCQWLPCDHSANDPYQTLRIVSREVIAHPATTNAVQVNVTLIHQGTQAIDFPVLGLSFKNIDGQVVAQRQFSPHEYLVDNLDLNAGIPPQQLIRVSLNLVDPGNSAVAFEFQFSSP